jgi:transcriptional regulator with XRE-family HTH domain
MINKPPTTPLASALTHFVERSGESIPSLAKRAEMPYTTFTQYLRGDRTPTHSKIKIIATVLGVHSAQIYSQADGELPLRKLVDAWRRAPKKRRDAAMRALRSK